MERSEQAFLAGFNEGIGKQAKVSVLGRLFGKKEPPPPTKTEKIKAVLGKAGSKAKDVATKAGKRVSETWKSGVGGKAKIVGAAAVPAASLLTAMRRALGGAEGEEKNKKE